MKYLRQYIRQMLLTEGKGMNTADMLPVGVVVVIKPVSTHMEIYYGKADNPDVETVEDGLGGQIDIYPTGNRNPLGDFGLGNCGGAWMVGGAAASHGWGPLLYDVAIEWATKNGGGLISDRGSVSDAAQGVWNYYMRNRDNVTAHQLDDLKNSLTPEEEDNCNQDIGRSTVTGIYDTWQDSALSKRYTKPPATIKALEKAGKLVIL